MVVTTSSQADSDSITFSPVSFTYTSLSPNNEGERRLAARISGRTAAGESVVANVTGFAPHFYVRFPDSLARLMHPLSADAWEEISEVLRTYLNASCASAARGGGGGGGGRTASITNIEFCIGTHRALMPFPVAAQAFIRIDVVHPRDVASLRDLIRDGYTTLYGMVGAQLESRGVEHARRIIADDHAQQLRDRMRPARPDDPDDATSRRNSGFNPIFEASTPYTQRLIADKQIIPCGWISVPRAAMASQSRAPGRAGRTNDGEFEFEVDVAHLDAKRSEGEHAKHAPLRLLSYDIECLSTRGQFPSAERGHPIIQISAHENVLSRDGEFVETRRTVFMLSKRRGGTLPRSGAIRRSFNNEIQMLNAFFLFMKEERFDIIVAHNGNGFDVPYIRTRARLLRLTLRFEAAFSRVPGFKPYVSNERQRFGNKQKGFYMSHAVRTPGIVNMDSLVIFRNTINLPSYSLNAISAAILGDTKDDVGPDEIIGLHESGPDGQDVVADYCMKDSLLVTNALKKRRILAQQIALARELGLDLQAVCGGAQGRRVVAKMMHNQRARELARARGGGSSSSSQVPHAYEAHMPRVEGLRILIPTNDQRGDNYVAGDDGFDGAEADLNIALNEIRRLKLAVGTTSEQHQAASLIAWTKRGIASNRLRLRRKRSHKAAGLGGDDVYTRKKRYKGATVQTPHICFYVAPIVTVDYSSMYPSIMIAYNLCYSTSVDLCDLPRLAELGIKVKKTPAGHYFVTQETTVGLLPNLLDDLLTARGVAKKALAAALLAGDKVEAAAQNLLQLVLKISANSVYGVTGSKVLERVAVSESVTGYGRTLIEQARAATEAHFTVANGYEYDAKVVYGDTDSIMIYFGPVTRQRARDLAAEAQELYKGIFPLRVKLVFEKILHPYLLRCKKKYASMLYVDEAEQYGTIQAEGTFSAAGTGLKRRDTPMLIRRAEELVVQTLFKTHSIDAVAEAVRAFVGETLLTAPHKAEDFMKSGLLGRRPDEYTSKTMVSVLTKRLERELPAKVPTVGDRIYYLIASGTERDLKSDRTSLACLPSEVTYGDKTPNVRYYFEMMVNAVVATIEPAMVKEHVMRTNRLSEVEAEALIAGGGGNVPHADGETLMDRKAYAVFKREIATRIFGAKLMGGGVSAGTVKNRDVGRVMNAGRIDAHFKRIVTDASSSPLIERTEVHAALAKCYKCRHGTELDLGAPDFDIESTHKQLTTCTAEGCPHYHAMGRAARLWDAEQRRRRPQAVRAQTTHS